MYGTFVDISKLDTIEEEEESSPEVGNIYILYYLNSVCSCPLLKCMWWYFGNCISTG